MTPGADRRAAGEREDRPEAPRPRRRGPGLVRSLQVTPIRITVDRAGRRARPPEHAVPPERAGAPERLPFPEPPGRAGGHSSARASDRPSFLDIAAIEDIDRDVFRARWPGEERFPVHTGIIAVQAQLAATRTVAAGRPLHSLHAHFPQPARARTSIVYLVDRVRDGGGTTTRRVTGVQAGQVVCVMSLLYRPGGPAGHQLRAPRVPPPRDLDHLDHLDDPEATLGGLRGPRGRSGDATVALRQGGPTPGASGRRDVPESLIDVRSVTGEPAGPGPREAVRPVAWVRLDQTLPDDPPVHAGALVLLADHVTTAFARQLRAVFARPPAGGHADGHADGSENLTALDHAIWIHQPFRADQWLLVVRDSPSGSGQRTLTRATFFSRDGRLVASASQDTAPG